jgi:hypothetical protein
VSLIDSILGSTLCVGLAPDHVAGVVRRGRRFTDKGAFRDAVDPDEGGWHAVLGKLRERMLQPDRAGRGLPVSVVLSSRWCRMMMVRWSDALMKREQAQRFLQSQYLALYGEAAREWTVVADDAPYGQPRLTCAIETDLLQSLRQVLREGGHACLSIEPAVPLSWRLLAGPRGSPVKAFAVVEAGRLSMAGIAHGRISAIQSHSLVQPWQRELARAWQRWVLRAPELGVVKEVMVFNLTAEAPEGDLPAPFKVASVPAHGLSPVFNFVACSRG